MEKKKNVPVLRFPEFSGEWEKKKLGELGDIITGSTPSTLNKDYYDGEYKFVSPFDIQDNRFVVNTKTTLTELGFLNGRKIRKGSTLFVCIGSTIGKIAQASIDCTTNQQINSISPIKNEDDFVFSLLQFHAKKIKSLSAEQAVPILNKTSFSQYILFCPILSEQIKIASSIAAIDNKLQTLKKKKTLLAQYKKGMMQKIFSQELRFKDDNGSEFPNWEKKRASKIFKNNSNKNHNGDLPILAITQDRGAILRDDLEMNIISSEASVKSYKIVEIGDFIISLRSFQGGIEYSNVMGICSPAYTILKPIIDIDSIFFKYYLKKESFIQDLSSTVIGIRDGKQISFDAFSILKLPYPCLEEQTKIANFLSAIDDKINLCNTQIEKTEQWKKGLLQKMFV